MTPTRTSARANARSAKTDRSLRVDTVDCAYAPINLAVTQSTALGFPLFSAMKTVTWLEAAIRGRQAAIATMVEKLAADGVELTHTTVHEEVSRATVTRRALKNENEDATIAGPKAVTAVTDLLEPTVDNLAHHYLELARICHRSADLGDQIDEWLREDTGIPADAPSYRIQTAAADGWNVRVVKERTIAIDYAVPANG